jgi:hypothetical protein
MTATPPPPTRSTVKIWGSPRAPRWSITCVEGTSQAEMHELVNLALDAHSQLRDGLKAVKPRT